MKDIRINDEILTGEGRFEPVLTWIHRHPEMTPDNYVKIGYGASEQEFVTLTDDHYIFEAKRVGDYIPAAQIQVGDVLRLVVGSNGDNNASELVTVGSIEKRENEKGLY